MPKRKNSRAANGAGTIRHRSDGRWEGKYIVSIDPATGKHIRKSIYGKTQKECRQKLAAAIAAVDNGTYTETKKITVKQWLTIWLETYCNHLAPRTFAMYKGFVYNRLIPAFGATKLDKLNATMIQRFYNDLAKELAPKTVKNIHGILHKALDKAAELEYIPKNPARKAILPRVEKTQIQPFSASEMQSFIDTIKGTRYELFFLLALFSGLRQGELLGLTWDRVNFETGCITIDRQLQIINNDYQFTAPKHNKTRVIFLAPFVMKLLHRQRIRQSEWKLATGGHWDITGYVFSDEVGRHLARQTVYQNFKKLAGASGRPDARFHDLRHTYACNALKAGDDVKTLSENLGHHSVAFTLDRYGHALDEMKRASANRMEAAYAAMVN